MRINTNIFAINAQRNLGVSATGMAKSMEKLSSGLRITRAADDAAGLSISEKLRAQTRGTNQAIRNAQDGISLIQTAEGALNEVHSMLQRINELALQGANDTLSDDDRAAAVAEINSLNADIKRVASVSDFNGTKLLDGTADLTLQIGAGVSADDQLQVTIAAVDSASIGDATTDGGTAASLDAAVTTVAAAAGATGDNFRDLAVAAQVAIKDVSTVRSSLGASQNRLEHVVANLGVAAENLSASESRIRDVDMAAEMVNLTKNQILQQAGTAILAQANQAPQSVLQLLR